LGECDVVSIYNDVLTEVSLSGESLSVGWRWLIHGPVVHWRVLNWVLSELNWLSIGGLLLVLGIGDIVWSNKDLLSESGGSHSVSLNNWINKDWNSLSEALLLGKSNVVVSYENLHSKVGISHSVLHDDWVDVNWDSLAKGLGRSVLLWFICTERGSRVSCFRLLLSER
jgi:hypothetical protein